MQETNSSSDEAQIQPESIIQNPLNSINFDIFSVDPEPMYSLIGKHVDVQTSAGTLHSGRVYTIDPISFSFVLLSAEEGTPQIIMGPCIKHVSLSPDQGEINASVVEDIFSNVPVDCAIDHADKQHLVEVWLKKNRVPVTRQHDVLSVMDVVHIHPPYVSQSCSGTNQIILGRIQKLIQNMDMGQNIDIGQNMYEDLGHS